MIDLNVGSGPLVPPGAGAAALGPETWGHSRVDPVTADDALVEFRAAAEARGILLPPEIIADGEIQRCDAAGRNGEGDAAYILHLDGLPAGGFQNWQDGIGWQKWHANIHRAFTSAESAELKRKAEADRAKRKAEKERRQAEAAARTTAIWEKAEPDPEHVYLIRKGIAAHGVRRENRTNNLIVPMYDETGALVNLQRIDPNGEKRFLPGGRKIGCLFILGDPDASDAILIGEGFATAATGFEATGRAAVVAFNTGNLLAIALQIRGKHPGKPLVLLADDDWQKDGNPGLTKAREVAAVVGGYIAVPQFGPDRASGDTDFNDLALATPAGLEQVKHQIEAALRVEPQYESAVPNDDQADGIQDGRSAEVVINLKDPLGNARSLLKRKFTQNEIVTLRRHREGFYHWTTSGAYTEVSEEGVRAELYSDLSNCWMRKIKGGLDRVLPESKMVSQHYDALRAAAYLREAAEAPAWLGEQPVDMPAHEMLSLRNGLLHLPSKSLIRHTPSFFTYNALPFDYEPRESEPKLWLRFLKDLWPNDQESIGTLQEIFGLCLTKNTEFQKIFLILGPRRSGKGTIGRILRAMLGAENVVSPTLASLSGEFGMWQLIGKLAAIISDARMTAKTDADAVAERLLNISGEDAVSINRKNTGFWNGLLQVRVVMMANGLPRFTDASGAFAGRFIILRIVPSFYGHEDLKLTEKLKAELPAILNWSIEGWERIADRGHFIQPKSGKNDMRTMEDMASPISVFMREKCLVGGDKRVVKNVLYRAWCTWCETHGRQAGNNLTFGKALKEVLPQLGEERPKAESGKTERPEYYKSIALKDDEAAPAGDPNRADRPYWDR
jgi:putative DNA primase/helicase